MKRLPHVKIKPAPIAQKRALALWLSEWRIDQALLDGEGSSMADSPHRFATGDKRSSLRYDSEPVRSGQIRLFHPYSQATRERARHIVVLKEHNGKSWLVAPFSRFSNPAVPGEWLTSLRVPALQVLCLWNARVVTESVLGFSWVVGCMSASKVARALAIHAVLDKGQDLSSSLVKRVGPPLAHPLDPRVEYIQEERDWFASAVKEIMIEPHTAHPLALPNAGVGALLRAAESRGTYRVKRRKDKPDRSS